MSLNSIISLVVAVALVVFIYWRRKRNEKMADDILSKISVQYENKPVFLCRWADIFEGDDAAIQMQGIVMADLNKSNKIVTSDGIKHSIIDLYTLTDDWNFDDNSSEPISSVPAGKKVNMIISAETWNVPMNMEQNEKVMLFKSNKYPDWSNFLREIDAQKVIALNVE